MLLDASELADGTELTYDLAVIGAGPAGITIAERLRGRGLAVALIEAGGIDPELQAQRSLRGQSVGRDYWPLDRCRFRVFGGSSVHWGGWCRPLDPVDFEARDWIAHSGWPIAHADLAAYYEQAAVVLGLERSGFALADWADVQPAAPDLGLTELRPAIVQHSDKVDFGERHGRALAVAHDVTTMLHATVTELRLAPGTSRVAEAQIRAPGGARITVRARTYVLAAGGIETPRLLLASRADQPAGLGNAHDRVGRFFMEHPHVVAGHIPGSDTEPDAFFRRRHHGSAIVHGFLVPTPEAMERRRLPNCSITIETAGHVRSGSALLDRSPLISVSVLTGIRRLRRGHRALARGLGLALSAAQRLEQRRVSGLHARSAGRRSGVAAQRLLSLYVRAEQTPDPGSRVLLDHRRDRHGMPLARLDWRLPRGDTAAILEWLVLETGLRARGHPGVVMPEPGWEDQIGGGPHHMGTTRMSADPRHGVVDADSRVHGLENLYVTGASVFTTGGYANPTLTVLALALRLAEHLSDEFGLSRSP